MRTLPSRGPGRSCGFWPGLGGLGLVAFGLGACSYEVKLSSSSSASVNLDSPVTPDDPGPVDVVVEVSSNLARHTISPLIYGTRLQADFGVNRQSLLSQAELRWSTYNWENNASNLGYEVNSNDGDLSGPSNSDAPGQAVELAMSEAVAAGVAVELMMPIGARVAADKHDDGDVRLSGDDYLTTRFRQNLPKKPGALSTRPDKNDDYVYQDEFLNWLKSRFAAAAVLFAMDDEPDLWSTVMRAARPVPPEILTWAELVQRNLDYAEAVKRIWPEAPVVGLASYGWTGWTRLDYYDGQNKGLLPADAGPGDFVDYYLSSLSSDQASRGRRLIDYLDLHWNSEAQGDDKRVSSVRTATGAEARVQAPRSFWDPSYVETSWITEVITGGTGIQLIPRIKDKINRLNPGTKLAIGSWQFGGEDHISGAIAVADTLGIFGREDIGMAALGGASGEFGLAGFRIFTNYDGQGARFGDTSIAAQTSDAAASSAYASVDQARPNRLVLVLINKRNVQTTIGIKVAHPTVFHHAEVYQLGPGSPAIMYQGTLPTTGTNVFTYTMEAFTAAVVLPQSQ